MGPQQRTVYQKAINAFGVDNQLFQLDEEMAELIKAVNKWRRNQRPGNEAFVADVAEEIADVEIMLDQLKIMLDIADNEIEDWKYRKIKRLSRNIP